MSGLTEKEKQRLLQVKKTKGLKEFGSNNSSELLREIDELRLKVIRKVAADPKRVEIKSIRDGEELNAVNPLTQMRTGLKSGKTTYHFFLQIGGVHNGQLIIQSQQTIKNTSVLESVAVRTDLIHIQMGPLADNATFRPEINILVTPATGTLDRETGQRVQESVRGPMELYLSKP